MAAGKLGPYHAVMLTSNKLAVHQHESQHGIAQQAQQRPAPHSNSGLIRSAVAQQAQHADEALSQEAAAVEEALGSFSRPSSSAALHSGHTPAPLLTHALTNASAQAAAATHSASQLTTASQQEEVSQGGAPQQLVVQSAAVQHPAGQLQADARGLQSTAPEGRLLTQAQVSLQKWRS